LERLSNQFGAAARVVYANRATLDENLVSASLVIGAVLIPGAAAPKLVTRAHLARMVPGAVLVDVSIDQGGCCETSRPTTHGSPTFVEEGIVHYCVPNMPGAVPHSSTYALSNATLAHVLALADKGWRRALRDDAHLRHGLNVCAGRVTQPAVADALGYDLTPAENLLEGD
ncbi:MAG: alanine dehydrogenase, partial [candidate division NC10 bacterium]|nr:alanine dehydrogenase [candidate division NC10 bacterium]